MHGKAAGARSPPGCGRSSCASVSFWAGRGRTADPRRLARWGLGGTIGTGRQYMSWIHEADLNAVVLRAIRDESMNGVYV
jgi:NAD dependent epimerase/dehydratase family enzyme